MGQRESIVQSHGPIAEDGSGGNLGNNQVEEDALASEIFQALENGESNDASKNSRAGWPLLSCIDTRQRDNEKLRVVKKQLKPRCEARGLLW